MLSSVWDALAITRYEAIFSVANQLPVLLPGCSYRLQLCRLFKMVAHFFVAAQQLKHQEAESSVLEFTVVGR